MRALLLSLALVPALVSCSAGDSATEPTPDRPRYTANQVQRAFLDYARRNDTIAICYSDMLEYEGDGLWSCGRWTFDERNGTILH